MNAFFSLKSLVQLRQPNFTNEKFVSICIESKMFVNWCILIKWMLTNMKVFLYLENSFRLSNTLLISDSHFSVPAAFIFFYMYVYYMKKTELVGLVTSWVSSNNHSSFSPISRGSNHAGQSLTLTQPKLN